MQPPRLSTAPTHYDDQLLSLLWLETVVPVGPFGIALRFKLARMTDESIDCDIPKGVPLIQQLANTLPPPESAPESQSKGAPWSMTLVHSLWSDHLQIPFEARPLSVSTGENGTPLLRFQINSQAQWSASLESLLKEWQILDPQYPLLISAEHQIMAS